MLYQSQELFIPWEVVNSWACQYFSLNHSLGSWLLLSQTICSINWTFRLANLSTSWHLEIKCLAAPLISLFLKLNCGTNILVIASRTSDQINYIYTVAAQLTSDFILLTCSSTNKVVIKTRQLLHISQRLSHFDILLGVWPVLIGKSEGDIPSP